MSYSTEAFKLCSTGPQVTSAVSLAGFSLFPPPGFHRAKCFGISEAVKVESKLLAMGQAAPLSLGKVPAGEEVRTNPNTWEAPSGPAGGSGVEVPGACWSLTRAEAGALPAEGLGSRCASGVSSFPSAARPGGSGSGRPGWLEAGRADLRGGDGGPARAPLLRVPRHS